MSVISSMSGIKAAAEHLSHGEVLLLSCLILVGLFALQHSGTHRVGFLFAPIVIIWLISIFGVGLYNVIFWNPKIVSALSPYYIIKFFRETRKHGWMSLGGVLLSVAGTEAMFADLGHFTACSMRVSQPMCSCSNRAAARAVPDRGFFPYLTHHMCLCGKPCAPGNWVRKKQIAFSFLVYPCLVVQYMGQAAFLSKNIASIPNSFYKSIPDSVYWPVFVIATLASIVDSQSIITATFSIVKQLNALGCFPRVKIVHTSKNVKGQIYIPEINWILMILTLSVAVGFQDTILIGNGYGLACMTGMFITTFLTTLVMIFVWQRNIALATCFLLFFWFIEGVYLSSAFTKIPQGGLVSLVLAFVFLFVMFVWHYGTRKKYNFDLHIKVPLKWLLGMGPSLGIVRVPGIGLVYSELATGVPSIFSHFVTNLPAFHSVRFYA